MRLAVAAIVEVLERAFDPVQPPVSDAFEFVVFEQVAYLASDEKRAAVFAELRERVGLAPEAILGASHATLLEICDRGGINGPERAARLKNSATLVLERCAGDLAGTLRQLPLPRARKLARSFDSFGAANAETLLLFAGLAVPALDSNGVRVLSRLWFGSESGRYAADHRRACEQLAAQSDGEAGTYLRAFALLRRHGKTICRRSAPDCGQCPLAKRCSFATT
jgi:endonuclease-3